MNHDLALNRLNAARALFEAGNYPGAERLLREVLAADPEFAPAHNLMALTLYQCGKKRDAITAANESLAVAPSIDALRAKALALNDLKRHREAIQTAREAVALGPNSPFAALSLAVTLEGRKQWREAEAEYRRAETLAPGLDIVRAALGRYLIRRRKLAEAEEVAARIAPASDALPVLLLRGEIALLHRRAGEARDYALWALSQNATHPAALSLLMQAKACRSWWLGLWWRYAVTIGTQRRWVRVLGMGVVLLLLLPIIATRIGNALFVAGWVYLLASQLIFQRMLQRELRTPRLNKTY